MIRVETPRDQIHVARVYEARQEQIFEYWDTLGPDERRALLAQLATIDFPEFQRLLRTTRDGSDEAPTVPAQLEPLPMIGLPEGPNAQRERQLAQRVGLESLRRGECAVLLVAGGQGTRLRAPGPKGKFPIGPVSGHSLFQVLAEQLLAMQRRVKRTIPWLIMTSESNHEETRAFFQEHGFFGLGAADVLFQPQGMLPVVDRRRGRILLESPGRIALSPNGHGGAVGIIRGLRTELERRGIRHLFTHQVDNPLLEVVDPTFLGFHLLSESQFSSKAVARTDPDERIGVFGRGPGGPQVIEYTELPANERHARLPDGKLRFGAGNVAAHLIALDFVCPSGRGEPFPMPYHRAFKAAPHMDGGQRVEPTEPNAMKFESFLFDLVPYSRNPIVFEVDRAEQFAPVKNAEGPDSPATSQAALIERWGRWLQAAGVEVARREGRVAGSIEISPLFAAGAEELAEQLKGQPIEFQDGLWLR